MRLRLMKTKGNIRAHKNLEMTGHYVSEDQILPVTCTHVCPICVHRLCPLAMSDLEGNFDVIILGTGLVESIAAA